MDWAGAAVFHESLASLLRAGMPIGQAVGLAGQAASGRHRQHAQAWASACVGGSPLAQAMVGCDLPPMEVALVEAGERSGRLSELSAMLARHYRHLAVTRRMLIGRLVYPVFLIHVALVVMAVPVVVPRLLAGEASSLLWLFSGPAILWLVLGAVLAMLRGAGRDQRTRWLFLPGLAGCTEAWVATTVCTVLHAAFAAGMMVPQALELAAGACGLPQIEKRLRAQAARAIHEGTLLSVALGRAGLPTGVVAQLSVAERAGSVDASLDRLTVEWQEHFDSRLSRLARTVAALVYGLAMLVAVATIISFYANYIGNAMQEADL
jgi:type IV pilus assembly protein PilC